MKRLLILGATGLVGQQVLAQALALKPEYWGAFVLDPDDHNMEMVCHGPGRA